MFNFTVKLFLNVICYIYIDALPAVGLSFKYKELIFVILLVCCVVRTHLGMHSIAI